MTKKGIMIIGHGSTLIYNKATMEMQAELLRKMGHENVYIGYNESSIPSIEEALIEMADAGIDEIVALPFFIASGLHLTRDIPPKLGLVSGETECIKNVNGTNVKIHYETPFGEDPALTDILADRIEELSSKGRNTGIMVMGHGSKLTFNSEIIELNAERLRNRGYRNVYVGYNEFNNPTIEASLQNMLDSGLDEIIALPLFMASGAHLSRDIPGKLRIPQFANEAEIENGNTKTVVKYALPVGADPRLCRILDKKIRKYY